MRNDEIVDWDMCITPPKRDMVGEYILMPIKQCKELETALTKAIALEKEIEELKNTIKWLKMDRDNWFKNDQAS